MSKELCTRPYGNEDQGLVVSVYLRAQGAVVSRLPVCFSFTHQSHQSRRAYRIDDMATRLSSPDRSRLQTWTGRDPRSQRYLLDLYHAALMYDSNIDAYIGQYRREGYNTMSKSKSLERGAMRPRN